MSIRDLKMLITDSEDLNKVQDYIGQALAPVLACPLLNGVQISATLATGANTVNHKLGRKPLGYLISAKSANIDVWGSAFSKTSLSLQASGAVTLTLWVY